MVLGSLGSSLYEALRRLLRAPLVDEKVVKELKNDILRALLQGDVNLNLVLSLSRRIEERAFKEKVPPGLGRRELVLKIVYEELISLLGGERPVEVGLKPGRSNVIMLVGIQGCGKTTSAAKLARYFKKRGFKASLVCADSFRPGAYDQLKQLAESIGVPFYGDLKELSSVKLAVAGVERFRREGYEVIIVDTAGRHKEEKGLIEEMKVMAEAIKPDEIMLVIDATIGQQAAIQAQAFNEATKVGSIFIAKLDGAAKGGGALSAVAATGAPIKFIGLGEKVNEVEAFSPPQFVGRLLGMGDLKALVEKVREAEAMPRGEVVEAFISGRFTLRDMVEHLQSIRKMGPLTKILQMIPGFGYKIPEEMAELTEEKIDRWIVITKSMTRRELDSPQVIGKSHMRRIALGSGTTVKDVKDMIEQYFMMKKALRQMLRSRRIPFLKGLKIDEKLKPS